MRSYKKLSAYRKHISRGCRLIEDTTKDECSLVLPTLPEMDIELEESELGDEDHTISHTLTSQWHQARFILSIKEKHNISQAAVDQVLTSTRTLLSTILDNITADLKTKRPEDVLGILEHRVCEASELFSELSTSYQQQKFFTENFRLVVRHFL